MNIMHLYKYGSINERSETLFSSPTIWFSAPSELNDPFECRPAFKFNPTEAQSIKMITRIIKERNPDMTGYDVTANVASQLLALRKVNPDTNRKIFVDHLNASIEKIGLYCLSKKADDILMWSHYAKNHYGYCLQFEASNNTFFFGAALPVKYRKDYPLVDCCNMSNEEQIDLVLLTKFYDWKYEQEYRIIDVWQGSGLHKYPVDLLKSIIFGLRMQNKEKDTIRQWVRCRGHAVKFYQASQSKTKFAIEIKEIK